MVKMKGMGGVTTTTEVVKVDEETVTCKMTIEVGGTGPQVTEMTYPRYAGAADVTGAEATSAQGKVVGMETIQVAGKSLKCKVWEMEIKAGDKTSITRTYLSEEVPGGTVKIEVGAPGQMMTIQEVIEYRK